MKALAIVPALVLAASTLVAPARVEAAHRHGPGCGHSYYSRGYSGYYGSGYYGRSYRYAPRTRYYSYPSYSYGYGYYPAYDYGYYYTPPPPPRYYYRHRRPRLGIYLGF